MSLNQDNRSLEMAIRHTELELFGSVNSKTSIIPMWLNLDYGRKTDSCLRLASVKTDNQWDILREARREIEIPFGIVESDKIDAMIVDIKKIKSAFSSDWFLAYSNDILVGSIGLVEFRYLSQHFGRLLDVDILPQFQGRGHGNQLLSAICQEASRRSLTGLCLRAEANGWVKNWYLRWGFKPVGFWAARPTC